MKRIVSLVVLMLMISSIYSQTFYRVPYYDWSSKIAFQLSPSPMITGYGPLSDSLSRAHRDTTFYESNGVYYPITSWADYYLWYVNEYWYYFDQPDLYEYYYFAGDDYGMAQFICGTGYHGYLYPARIAITFPGREVYRNYYSVAKVKRRAKNDYWVNKNYVALDEKNKSLINERKRNYALNDISNRERRMDNIVYNNKVGSERSKYELEKSRRPKYTNGPSSFDKTNSNERMRYVGNTENSNNWGGNRSSVSVSSRTNSSTNRVNSSTSNSSVTSSRSFSSGNIKANNSRQTQTSSGRGR